MRTLDEVIKALSNCADVNANFEACECCGYREMHDDGYDCGRLQMMEDVLHYLKEYKIKRERIMAKAQDCEDAEKRLQDEIARYQETVKEYEDILTDYVVLKQYWAEQQANPALTLDELKTLKGKPVWIELLGKGQWKGWDVICGFYTDDFGDAMCTARLDDYYLTDHGKTWQAYRKERHELDQKAH